MYVVFIACQVELPVGDSGLCCCGPAFNVMCDVNLFERNYFPLFVDSSIQVRLWSLTAENFSWESSANFLFNTYQFILLSTVL